MSDFTYEGLVAHFGETIAGWCLTEIEKAARISPRPTDVDHENRLAAALRAQDAMLAPLAVA
jgi:hypothetical protein